MIFLTNAIYPLVKCIHHLLLSYVPLVQINFRTFIVYLVSCLTCVTPAIQSLRYVAKLTITVYN